MNRPIVRLFGLVVVMFAVLIGFTSRWTVFQASGLRDNPLNRRSLLEQERVPRGRILAADGTVLARSVRGEGGVYQRRYPTGSLFSHAVGYAFIDPDLGETGLELTRNSYLNGTAVSGITAVLHQLQGVREGGDDVLTTLDMRAQRVARSALAGHTGAVVALDPRTGAVRVMVSTPSFDPQALTSVTGTRRIERNPGKPLVNRVTQYGYAPGSTFKIITATAALDTGLYTPQSVVDGTNNILISGTPLRNDDNENPGPITLTQALAQSVNTVWAQVAVKVGKQTLGRYMARFGFDRKPQLDYPPDEMSASGEYLDGHILAPTSDRVDVGRLGIGQDKLAVTPLQMVEVAAAVANHGTLMVPHMTDRVIDADGRSVLTVTPRVQSHVMKPSTAADITKMMEAVVTDGTGTAAQIPGVAVAGKTGTAETQFGNSINNVWFIAFAPAQHPTVAIAVTLKAVPGQGAEFAAPVAKQVMEALLHG
jgi:peptidoglycan glycosyltransferase